MWVKDVAQLGQGFGKKYIDWMLQTGNLGESLRKVCKNLTLNLIEQNFCLPFTDEIRLLGLDEARQNKSACYIRKIFLEGDGVPFSYGRVVVPKFVYLNHVNNFNSLGTRLIGETMLYGNPGTTRSPFEYNKIDAAHPLFDSIAISLPDNHIIAEIFFARRSVFYINGSDPLLITEAFMSEIPPFSEQE